MEGHRGLPSAADVQGKAPPPPPALPPGPVGQDLWLSPSPVAVFCPTPCNSIPCAGVIPSRGSSPRDFAFNWKTKTQGAELV